MNLAPLVHAEVRRRLDRLDVDFGPHGLDRYGTSKADLGLFFSALQPFYRSYFRVRVHGVEHVPARGRAMVVCNHSGGMPVDALMLLAALFFELDPPRLAHGMAEKFLAALPFFGDIARRVGQITGLPEHASRLLEDDRILMVFPEGVRGTAKLFPERHGLVRFGTGFVRLALHSQAPIVPAACVGAGNAVPTVANAEGLGRLFGLPYVPLTPYLLPLPLPSRIDLCFGAPLRFPGDGSEEDEVIERHVEAVKERIAALIQQGLEGEAR
ncbi:MAG: lysophospholipid acyltransferase family protein [Myxococcales bacterium]